MELANRFGRNVVAHRKAAGISQEELGFIANLHRTEVGMLERGIRLPRLDTILKLAGALEIEPGELLQGMSWSPAAPSYGAFKVSEEDSG